MRDAMAQYLAKRAEPASRWPLEGDTGMDARQVVVVPCLAESENVSRTLEDLARQAGTAAAHTLVICVVNNRPVTHASPADIADNAETLSRLRTETHGLRLALVDASSEGRELPPKEGVGLARKIGLDHGLRVLQRNGAIDGALVCLDGDTRVDRGYLSSIEDFFASAHRWGAVIAYAHAPARDPQLDEGILAYEMFLRYHARGLAWCGSPYAFHTIGSTMACTARAYATVAGMPKRTAGEDFYFLDKLAKAGHIEPMNGTVVRCSPRASHRVPFGTGRRMSQLLSIPDDSICGYHPASYRALRAWLQSQPYTRPDLAPEPEIDELWPALRAYLEAEGYSRDWPRMYAEAKSERQRRTQFHRWFDSLRTLRAFHHLREASPDVPIWELPAAVDFWNGDEEMRSLTTRVLEEPANRRRLLHAARLSDLRQDWRRGVTP